MRIRKNRALLLATMLFFASYNCTAVAQKVETILDKSGIVRSFEKMEYPQLARQARIEGDVVVQVKLDSVGKVIWAGAISGAKLLMTDAVSNVQEWRFSADTGVVAIIVYEFRIRKSKCKRGESKSQFVFREPNIASVAGCIDEWQP